MIDRKCAPESCLDSADTVPFAEKSSHSGRARSNLQVWIVSDDSNGQFFGDFCVPSGLWATWKLLVGQYPLFSMVATGLAGFSGCRFWDPETMNLNGPLLSLLRSNIRIGVLFFAMPQGLVRYQRS
jgi:hypothetical protein